MERSCRRGWKRVPQRYPYQYKKSKTCKLCSPILISMHHSAPKLTQGIVTDPGLYSGTKVCANLTNPSGIAGGGGHLVCFGMYKRLIFCTGQFQFKHDIFLLVYHYRYSPITQWAQIKFSTLNQRWSSTILQLNQNSTRFQPFFNHLEIKVDSQRWCNVESTLRINLSFQGKYGWSSTLIQRLINVEDQPFSHEI